MQLYAQLKSLNPILKKLPQLEGGAIFTNKSGKFLFALYVSRVEKTPAIVWLLKTREELDLLYYAADIEQQAPNFEEYREADWFRQGIRIEEKEVTDIPAEQFNDLFRKGINLFKQKKVIYATYKETYEFQEGEVIQGANREFTERLLNILLTGHTFRQVTKTIHEAADKQIPVYTYNQRTGECLFAEAWEPVGDISAIPEWKSYVSRKPETLLVPELGAREQMRSIKPLPKKVVEVKIGLLPIEYHMQLDPMFPLCYQQVGDGHVHILSFDLADTERAYRFVQFQLLKNCREAGYCPKKIVTRGPYASLLKNILHPILKKLDVIVEEVAELPVLDHLVEIAKAAEEAAYFPEEGASSQKLLKIAASLTPEEEVDALIASCRQNQFDKEFLKRYIIEKRKAQKK